MSEANYLVLLCAFRVLKMEELCKIMIFFLMIFIGMWVSLVGFLAVKTFSVEFCNNYPYGTFCLLWYQAFCNGLSFKLFSFLIDSSSSTAGMAREYSSGIGDK